MKQGISTLWEIEEFYIYEHTDKMLELSKQSSKTSLAHKSGIYSIIQQEV